MFTLSAVAVGQRFGGVSSVVQVYFNNSELTNELDESQYVQRLRMQCTNLICTLQSLKKEEIIILLNTKNNLQPRNPKGVIYFSNH